MSLDSTDPPAEGSGAPASGLTLDRLPLEIRPDPSLLNYYLLTSLLLGPFFFLPLIPRLFRYRTLRYRLDEEGISMRWGVLFHGEVSLNYARIQDIHLSSNVVERWLGLGKIQIQTASGSSKAEMVIEGVPQLEAMRDFLYLRTRGAASADDTASEPDHGTTGTSDAMVSTLQEVVREVRALRLEIAGNAAPPHRPRAPGDDLDA